LWVTGPDLIRTLETATPDDSSYDEDTKLCCSAHQGSKKLKRNKIIGGECIWRSENVIKPNNSVIKVVIDKKKFQKMT
jgi:hypothetical protein